MISIKKGEKLAWSPGIVVAADTGEYADFDLIECASTEDKTFAVAQYQAQYIRYGDVVYQHSSPEALGEALVALDPESTHDAAQLWREDEARRIARSGGNLKPEDPTPAPDAVVEEPPQEEIPPEETPEESESNETAPEENAPEETPVVPELPPDNTSTTTPATPEPEAYDPGVYGEALVPPPTAPELPPVEVVPEVPPVPAPETPTIDVSTTSPE